MDADTAYTVYKNARVCASKYRHGVIAEAELTQSDFATQMRVKGYVVFSSQRKGHPYLGDMHTTWVVIGSGSPASVEVKHFRTMWSSLGIVPKTAAAAPVAGDEPVVKGVIFVSEKAFKHFVTGELASYRRANPSVQIEETRWGVFLFEIPLHNANCPHEIVNPKELETYLSRTYTDPVFKGIRTGDPQAIWIGARAGDVIRIDMTSFSAGVAIDYRICED